MIELRHISKIFPTADGDFQALSDVSLTIQDGDIFGIVGMSGAGKSTLVRCINLLEKPTSGQVLVDGLVEAALRAGVRYALDVYPHYSSDADVAVCAGNDVRHCVVGAGVYASHGYERSHIEGLANTFDLLNSYIETAD